MNMKFKKTIIAASIMAFSTGALAGWMTPTTTTSVVHGIPSNIQVGTTLDADFKLTGGVALTVGNMIVFKLTNGATFNPTATSGLLTGGLFNLLAGTNANELKFEVITSGIATNSTISLLTSSIAKANLSAVPANGGVDIIATAYSDTTGTSAKAALNNVSLKAASPAGTGVYLFESAGLATCGVVHESDTANVGDLFKKFTPSTTTGTTISNTITVAANTTVIPAGKIIIKIAGDFTGIQKVMANPTGAVTILGWTGSDASGITTGGTANEFKIDGNFAYLANSNPLPISSGGTGSIDATFTLDGTTVQAERIGTDAFKFSVDITDPAYAGASLKDCDKSTYSIERNGSSFLMNTFGTAVKLKISDVSGKDLTGSGNITFVGYKADGTEVPSTLTSYALSKNGSVSIPASDMVTGFAPTPITDVKKIVATVESEAIIASSVRKHPVTGNKSTIVYVNKADTDTGGI